MTAFWFWVIVAIAFAIVEVMTVAFFAVFITVGALGAAITSLLGFNLLVQAIVLGVLGVAGILTARPFLVERLHIGRAGLRSGADSMVGHQAVLLEPILGVGQPGHVKISGELWPALTDDGSPVPVNTLVSVNATIFSQVVDPRLALFSVSNYFIAIDQLSRTTLRAIFGGMSLDDALSQRERINAQLQAQMESVTDKWGIRINRIEIVDITPPQMILNALALQKTADQEKRAFILKSEGQQQSQINIADGQKQAQIKTAEGDKQSAILRAEGLRQATILEAEGRAQAVETVYKAIKDAAPDPILVSILQLDTLSKFANSENAKLVVPVETAGLLGAAQALRSVLDGVPTAAKP